MNTMPPPPLPAANRLSVSYNPDSIGPVLEDLDACEVAEHCVEEIAWNNDVYDVVSTALRGTPRDHRGYRIRCAATKSLWTAEFRPGDPKFRDVPMQMKLVELVLRKRFKRENVTAQEIRRARGSIGSHVPDMITWLQVKKPTSMEYTRVKYWTLPSLVAEFKVTSLMIRNGKPVVDISRSEYPELADEWEDDIASHRSWSTSAGGADVAQVVRLDGIAKWRACLAKTAVYLLLAAQYCGTYFGYAMVGTRFCRILHELVDDQLVLFIECQSTAADSSILALADYLADDSNAHSLPWDLLVRANVRPQWNLDAWRTLLDFTALSCEVLVEHPRTKPPVRLKPLSELSPRFRARVEEIRHGLRIATEESDQWAAAIESRNFPVAVKTKIANSTYAPPKPDDQDSDEDERSHEGNGLTRPATPKRLRRSARLSSKAASTRNAQNDQALLLAVETWREDVQTAVREGKALFTDSESSDELVTPPLIGAALPSEAESSEQNADWRSPDQLPNQPYHRRGSHDLHKLCSGREEDVLNDAMQDDPCSRSLCEDAEDDELPIKPTMTELIDLLRDLGVRAVLMSPEDMDSVVYEARAECSRRYCSAAE